MAQRFWLYKNLRGETFEISIYHGDKTGHVLIYVGREILQIDFSVKTMKEYTFMLEEELFRLGYYPDKPKLYELWNETHNKEVLLLGESPENPFLIWQLILLVVVLVAILTILYFLIR